MSVFEDRARLRRHRRVRSPDNCLGLDWSQFLDCLLTSEVHEIVPEFKMGCRQRQLDRLGVPSPENCIR